MMIRSGALGDTLLMLPALAALRKKAIIHFAGRQPGLDYIRDAVFNAMDLEVAGWHRLFSERPFLSSNSPLPVSEANKVLAFFKDQEGIIRKNLEAFFPNAEIFVFPAFPPKFERIHVARYLADCLVSAGLPLNSDSVIDEARRSPLLSGPWISKQRDRMVFHPGSGDPKKNYPPDFWRHVFRIPLTAERFSRLKPTLLLGPAEASIRPVFERFEEVQKGIEVLFCPEREPLLKLLGSAALFVGQDSGITHLSGLMGTPTVALFKHSDPFQWGPLGPHVRIIPHETAAKETLERVIDALLAMAAVDN